MRNVELETEIILMEIWTLTKCMVHDRVHYVSITDVATIISPIGENGKRPDVSDARDTKTHVRDMLCHDEQSIFFFERRSDGSEIMFNCDDIASDWKKNDALQWDHFVYRIDSD